MNQGLLFIFLITLLSCKSANETARTGLNGKWVDLNTETDTLIFGYFGDKGSMILERGKDSINGFTLPKYGSGPYEYKLLTGDKISLRSYLSSNSEFNDYFFEQRGDKLTVEKFYDTITPGEILIFKKLE